MQVKEIKIMYIYRKESKPMFTTQQWLADLRIARVGTHGKSLYKISVITCLITRVIQFIGQHDCDSTQDSTWPGVIRVWVIYLMPQAWHALDKKPQRLVSSTTFKLGPWFAEVCRKALKTKFLPKWFQVIIFVSNYVTVY